jgi:hypothetical protein
VIDESLYMRHIAAKMFFATLPSGVGTIFVNKMLRLHREGGMICRSVNTYL